jgi:hypothetical protein
MYVYGIPCSPNDLFGLPANANADYYMDYGLLIFPAYTKPTSFRSHGPEIQPDFWSHVKKFVEAPFQARVVDLEHPYISTEEHEVVVALKRKYPTLDTYWFYLPKVVNKNAPQNMVVLDGSDDESDESDNSHSQNLQTDQAYNPDENI